MHLGFLTIFWRDLIRFYRFKTLLISSLVQPALWMAFFGIAMSSNFNRFTSEIPLIPGVPSVDYLTYMAAGVIAMTTLFTSLFGGMSLLFDKNWGLMREIFASPLPRNHIIFGIATVRHDQVIYTVDHHHGIRYSYRRPVLFRLFRSKNTACHPWHPPLRGRLLSRIPLPFRRHRHLA